MKKTLQSLAPSRYLNTTPRLGTQPPPPPPPLGTKEGDLTWLGMVRLSLVPWPSKVTAERLIKPCKKTTRRPVAVSRDQAPRGARGAGLAWEIFVKWLAEGETCIMHTMSVTSSGECMSRRVFVVSVTSTLRCVFGTAGILSLLSEEEVQVKVFALNRLNQLVDDFWAEIAESVSSM